MFAVSLLGCVIVVVQVPSTLSGSDSSSTGVFLEPRHESTSPTIDPISGWRVAEGAADILWTSTRSSMPCAILSTPSLLKSAALGFPSLLQDLNWTRSTWWNKDSVLKSICRLPAGHGNQTLVKTAPFQHLRKTSMNALFSSAPPTATEHSVIFDWDMINRSDALLLKQNVWLEESLSSFIDIRPQWFFLSAQPLGHWRGVGLHHHGQSFAALATGRKLWLLFPPGSRAMAAQKQRLEDGVGARLLWDWLASDGEILNEEYEELPLVCAQAAGEVMLVPDRWYHGTVPVGDALGVTIVENARTRDPHGSAREEM